MKTLKVALLVVVLLCLGIVAGCQEGQARSSSNRVGWDQGQTGIPHPSIAYSDAR